MKLDTTFAKDIHFDASEFQKSSLAAEAPAPSPESRRVDLSTPTSSVRIQRLMQWRESHRELHRELRVAGIRRSEKVREVLRNNHTGVAKQRWMASIRKNPKFQPTTKHVAAKEWNLRAPDGRVFTFRNLRHFIREQVDLFDAKDVIWKPQGRSTTITWCVAYQALARLRPGGPRTLESWEGWTWCAQKPAAVAA